MKSRFYIRAIRWAQTRQPSIEIRIRPRRHRRAICGGCHQAAPTYDHLPIRRFWFIPLWLIPVVWLYAMRRVALRARLKLLRCFLHRCLKFTLRELRFDHGAKH